MYITISKSGQKAEVVMSLREPVEADVSHGTQGAIQNALADYLEAQAGEGSASVSVSVSVSYAASRT